MILLTIIWVTSKFTIEHNTRLALKTKSKYTKWEEKVISVSEDKLILENEIKITYHYKKFIPYSKRK